MQSYGDIIKRIAELIILSEEKKKELNNLYENEYNKYFTRIYDYDIYIDYIKEFRDLLNFERVFYNLQTGSNILKKNAELLELCQKNANDNDYLILAELLKNVQGQSALNITYYNGYYVLNESLNEFISLCQKLKVGPCVKIIDAGKEAVQERINEEQNEKRNQYERINRYLEKILATETDEKVEKDTEKANYLPKNYKELLYLGIQGKLTKTALSTLKNIMSENDFLNLLDDLIMYQVFSEEELEKLRPVKTEMIYVDSIDELVRYFATLDDLNIDALRLLVPSMGINNYSYLMDELFKLGKIDLDTYLKSVKEYLDTLDMMDKRA